MRWAITIRLSLVCNVARAEHISSLRGSTVFITAYGPELSIGGLYNGQHVDINSPPIDISLHGKHSFIAPTSAVYTVTLGVHVHCV